MEFFVNEILENEDLKKKIINYDRKEGSAQVAQSIINGHRPNIEKGIFPLCVLAYLAPYALELNNKRGIAKDITVKTLKDVNVWVDNYYNRYSELGLGEFHWLVNHYTGDLFRLGRLQFRLEKSLDGIPEGEYAIETHIPQGEALTEEKCLESFKCATTFFKKYFPQTPVKYFMCDSWLLNPNLADILNEKSNIVKFMRLWTPVSFASDNSSQAIERVFGFDFKRDNIKNAPENTSLQKALKEYLLSGGDMDLTLGWRKI